MIFYKILNYIVFVGIPFVNLLFLCIFFVVPFCINKQKVFSSEEHFLVFFTKDQFLRFFFNLRFFFLCIFFLLLFLPTNFIRNIDLYGFWLQLLESSFTPLGLIILPGFLFEIGSFFPLEILDYFFSFLNIENSGITFLFLFLTYLIFTFVYLYGVKIEKLSISNVSFLTYLFLEICVYICFLTNNLFIFYIFFELTLFAFFLLISFLGSRERKIHATYFLIIYTFLGSLFLLISIAILYIYFGTANIETIISLPLFKNMGNLGLVLFLCLFFGFFVKIPLFPLHLWLLEAHVEAHTTTSVVLAALILKLGGIGMWKFMIPFGLLYVNLSIFLSYIVFFVIIGLIITSFSMIQQIDLKKFVAYSSIVHMGFSILALLQLNESGLMGFLLSMFAHGFSSAGLFFCVGMLYERFGSRNSFVYSGLSTIMPLFSFSFFIFLLCNASFPFTINFLGEIICFLSLQEKNLFFGLFIIFLLSATVFMSLWVGVRILFGNKLLLSQIVIKEKFADLNNIELFILFSLIIFVFAFGTIFSSVLFYFLKSDVLFLAFLLLI